MSLLPRLARRAATEVRHRAIAVGIASALVVSLALLAPSLARHEPGHEPPLRPGEPVPGRFIVQLQRGATAAQVGRAHEVRPLRSYRLAFNGFVAEVPPGRLRALQNDPRVASVVPDRVVRALPLPPGRGKKRSAPTSELTPSGVERIGAAPEAALGVSGLGVGVAVLDTGVDLNHPDLATSTHCFDAFGGDCDDRSGHGTHVAGTIAALHNGLGVVGVAPDVLIYAVRVLGDDGAGTDSAILAGLEWVLESWESVTPPIRIVNMSLGRPGNLDDSPPLREAIARLSAAGITVVTSAGNDPTLSATDQVPASYPEVIAVASSTAVPGRSECALRAEPVAADALSYFSSFAPFVGGTGVSVTAPGSRQENLTIDCSIEPEGILSLFLDGQYAESVGTSMAAPHVTGVVALLLERTNGDLTPEQARAAIRAGATGIGELPSLALTQPCDSPLHQAGILSAPGALAMLRR